MKKILHTLILITAIALSSSCEDQTPEFKSTASITVINAVVGQGAVKVNTSNGASFSYAKAPDLAYGTSGFFGAYPGNNLLKVVSSADTTKALFNRAVELRTISTLYLAGRVPNIDTIFRTESNLPFIVPYKDESEQSMFIRFINLSPNSNPISINILNSTTKEVTALPYKGITDFIKYPAQFTTANYSFEMRDAVTDARLTTTPIRVVTNSSRYKTISIIIKGLVGTNSGTDIFNSIQVNYN